jgi:hypothetical protein
MATKETSLRSCIEDLSSKTTDYKYPEQAINLAESLNSLSTDLYTDNIRFIYDLIQNADDAKSINVHLSIVEDKYLIIAHNGKINIIPFTYIISSVTNIYFSAPTGIVNSEFIK